MTVQEKIIPSYPNAKYCFDTDVYISTWRYHYPKDIFIQLWKALPK